MASKLNWSFALIDTIKNSEFHVIKSDIAVVIQDKYPKSKQHFLVLPWEDIDDIYCLSLKHLTLLNEMNMLAQNAIEITGQPTNTFKIGFHAAPSMRRLHLHVISNDFCSPYLKTKIHWNSFNTNFFILFSDIYNELKKSGKIEKIDKKKTDDLLKTQLRCHVCDYIPSTMPNLKSHLNTHC